MGKRVSVRLPPGRRRKPSGPGVCAGEGERRSLAQETGRPDGWSPAPNDGGPSAWRAGGEVRSRSRSWEKRPGAAPRDAAREAFALSAAKAPKGFAWPDDAILVIFSEDQSCVEDGLEGSKNETRGDCSLLGRRRHEKKAVGAGWVWEREGGPPPGLQPAHRRLHSDP